MSTLTVASNGSKGKADCCGVMKHTKMKAESQGFFLFFSANTGLRIAKGGDLAQSSGGEKIASAESRITSIHTQE